MLDLLYVLGELLCQPELVVADAKVRHVSRVWCSDRSLTNPHSQMTTRSGPCGSASMSPPEA